MTWTKLSDNFTDRPEVLGLSDSAFRLLVESLVWCNRLLTDGAVSAASLTSISRRGRMKVADELVAAGLWDEDEDGWTVVDFHEDQPTREQVQARRAANNARVSRWREVMAAHTSGDHSGCTSSCRARNAVGNGVRNAVGNAYPDPSRPVPSRKGSGTGSSDEAALPDGGGIGADDDEMGGCEDPVCDGYGWHNLDNGKATRCPRWTGQQ
ncbi:MAG: hypothetical protein F2842_02110 [Actinobacteria bacterium]|nr:hypothetical protein [Actinomycetota bacterium]